MSSFIGLRVELSPMAMRRALMLSVIGVVVDLGIVLSTFVPGAPWVSVGLIFGTFVGAIGLFGGSMLAAAHPKRWRWPIDVARSVPVAAVLAFVLLFVATVTVLSVPTHGLRGDPQSQDGRYYFDDHGFLVPTDTTGYRRAITLEDREFAGVALVFYAAAALGYLALSNRRGERALAAQ